MSNRHITDAEIEGVTNSPDRIHVEEFKTRDFHVFAVHYHGQLWKRLRPKHEAPFWVERNAEGLYGTVSKEMENWLVRIWKHSERYPQVLRFPRSDREGERLIRNLAYAHQGGQIELVQHYLEQIQKRIVAPMQQGPAVAARTWNALPRFDPSLVNKTRWLIEGFLVQGGIQLVYGERGSFKSTLFLCAAKAVACEEDFLGMETLLCPVLYLDYENPANVLKDRNESLGLGLPKNLDLIVWDRFGSQPTPRPGDPLLENLVKRFVEQTGMGPWIILDSWASLLKPGEGGETTGQVAPIYAHIRHLCDLGATVTVLDHTRKYLPEIIYGGADKEAKVDTIHNLVVYPNELRPENPIVRVESWLKRYAPKGVSTFAVKVLSKKDQNNEWHILGLELAEDPQAEGRRQKRQILRDLIRRNPSMGQEALAKQAATKGLGRDEAIDLLKKGIGKHWEVQKTAHGKFVFRLLEA